MFHIVGERINTFRKQIREAVEAKDAALICGEAEKQQAAGAHAIEICAGARIGREAADMAWLIETVQLAVSVPLCIDSADPKVLEAALGLVRLKPFVNSITLESSRLEPLLAVLKGKNCRIVALCMDDSGMPKSASDIVDRARRLVEILENAGFARDDIFVDPMVQPIGVNTSNGVIVIEATKKIVLAAPGVHLICGLSNISYGLPQRRIINAAFLTLMTAAGLDAAILDPLDRDLMTLLTASQMLLDRDEFCENYLKAVRS